MTLIAQLVASKNLRRADSLIFAMLSHGAMQEGHTKIEFSDGSTMNLDDILIEFNNQNCKSLVGRPKVFLFPFCR